MVLPPFDSSKKRQEVIQAEVDKWEKIIDKSIEAAQKAGNEGNIEIKRLRTPAPSNDAYLKLDKLYRDAGWYGLAKCGGEGLNIFILKRKNIENARLQREWEESQEAFCQGDDKALCAR